MASSSSSSSSSSSKVVGAVTMMAILVVASCFLATTPVESRLHQLGKIKNVGCQEIWLPCTPWIPCCTGTCPIVGFCVPVNILEEIVDNAKAKEASNV